MTILSNTGGDVAAQLLAYASANAVDLIAVGSHATTLGERLRFGSVATRIIRSAECGVLVSGKGQVSQPRTVTITQSPTLD